MIGFGKVFIRNDVNVIVVTSQGLAEGEDVNQINRNYTVFIVCAVKHYI